MSSQASTAELCAFPGCGRAFLTTRRLHMHQAGMRHFAFDYDFPCFFSLCGKSFETLAALEHHAAVHQTARPYVCGREHCSKTCTTKHGLEEHRRTMHPKKQANVDVLKDRSLTCSYHKCDREFPNVQALSRHQSATGHVLLGTPLVPEPLIRYSVNVERMTLQDSIIAKKELHCAKIDGTPYLPKRCRWVNAKLEQQCMRCARWLSRCPTNFAMKSVESFETTELGKEKLNATCRECDATVKGTGIRYLKSLLGIYPQLTLTWAKDQLAKQSGKGLITNFEMMLTRKTANAIGVHRYNNDLDHTPDNCFFECRELNVPQGESIPSLFEAWQAIFAFLDQYLINPLTGWQDCLTFKAGIEVKLSDLGIETQYVRTKEERALRDRESQAYHFRSIIQLRIQTHIQDDVARGRMDPIPSHLLVVFKNNVYSNAVQKLTAQGFRCHYSGVPLTIEKGFARFSFERINNDLPHFCGSGELSNIVFVCRLLNACTQLSRAKILNYYLHQTLVTRTLESHKKAECLLQSEDVPLSTVSLPNTERQLRWVQTVGQEQEATPTENTVSQLRLANSISAIQAKIATCTPHRFRGSKGIDIQTLELQLEMRKVEVCLCNRSQSNAWAKRKRQKLQH